MGAASVAGELRHLLVGKGDDDPPIAGGDGVADVAQLEPCLAEDHLHDPLGRADRLGTGGQNGVFEHLAVLEDQGLGAGRADIHAGDVQNASVQVQPWL